MSLLSDSKTGFYLAFRARYFFLFFLCLMALALAVFLAAQFSGRQPATVGMDVGLSFIRFLSPLMLVLMTQELLSREFERRYYLGSITYPRARRDLLLGRFLAIAVLTLGLLVVMGLLLAALVLIVGQGYSQGTPVALGYQYGLTIVFIGVDLLLLIAVACLLAIFASTPSFVLIGTFGFMLVARSYVAIIDLLRRDASLVADAEEYRSGVGVLLYLLPDLGSLDVRMIALYGKMEFFPSDWPLLLLSSLAYTVGLIALAVWALQRKRFF